MKLAKTSACLIALMAGWMCVAPGLWAQDQPAPRTTRQERAAKAAKAAAGVNMEASPQQAPPAADDKIISPGTGKRDPFMPLINEKKDSGGMEHLPPGKAGLVIASVRVDGTLKSPSGMIAVVSNPEQKVYFVREGDRLYDGDVEKIGLDGVTFKENSKDAFGKLVEHMVTKRIYPSAGEQQ
jgi:hypothetical protein